MLPGPVPTRSARDDDQQAVDATRKGPYAAATRHPKARAGCKLVERKPHHNHGYDLVAKTRELSLVK